ncbi:hypothetical protein [Phenylobacterium sp.]|jgi:hypothetical protein
MNSNTPSDEAAMAAQTRLVRWFALVLAVAGFATAMLIAAQSGG